MAREWSFKITRDQWILLAILSLGLFLRIYDLGKESLWIDEVVSVRLAHQSFSAIIMDRTRNVHPPFYFLLEHGWVGLFGDSEFAARFLSALFGFFAILMIYKVGRLLFDKEVGLSASLLLALSTFHIRFSQEARSFSLVVLLTLTSIYFLLKIQLGETRPWDHIAYALSTVLLIYTHYYGLFIVIAENLYVASAPLLFKKESRIPFQRWIFLQVSVILLFAPWVPILFKQFWRVQKKGGFSGAVIPSLEALYKTFWFYSGNRMLMALLVLLAFLSLATYSRKPRDSTLDKGLPAPREESQAVAYADSHKFYLLSLWLIIPVALPFLASQFSSPIYSMKYAIGASPAFYLLAAKGIKNLMYAPAKLAVTIILVALCLTNAWGYYQNVQKEQWREIARFIDGSAKPGDLLLFNAGFSQRGFDYYSGRADLIKAPFPQKRSRVDEETLKELAPAVKSHDRVWVILSHSRDDKGLIVQTLGKTFRVLYHQRFLSGGPDWGSTLKRIDVYLFEKPEGSLGTAIQGNQKGQACPIRQ